MTEPSPALTDRAAARSHLWLGAILVLAAVLAYQNTWHAPFVFDDASSIVTNPTIRRIAAIGDILTGPVTNVTAQGRPMLNLSLAINYALGGSSVEGYHVGNLIIHILGGLTLFGLIRRTCVAAGVPACRPDRGETPPGATGLAFAIALLWIVHPLQTESVTYVIQRAESLVGLFYLLTLYCFVRAVECHLLNDTSRKSGYAESSGAWSVDARPLWLALSVIACLLGMATKEVMATAPLMVLFFDRCFFAGTFRGAWRRRRTYYVALAGTWLLLAWLIARTGGNRGGSVGFGVSVGWLDYWLTQFEAITRYLWLSVWPHPLVFEYGVFWVDDFGQVALPMALTAALLVATVYALWRKWPLGFLGAWFFGILAPTSLAPGTTQMIVEHRMYLPLAAAIALGVVAVRAALRRRFAGYAAVAAVGLALTLTTRARNQVYRTDVALWSDTATKRPKNPLAHFMLAGAFEHAGQTQAAQQSYQRALELKPDFSIGQANFAEFLLREGRRSDAIPHFEAALQLQRDYLDAHLNLGNAYLAESRFTEAVGHLEQAVQLAPNSAVAHCSLGNALAAAGLHDNAVDEFRAALRLDPRMAEAHFNLGNALLETQRLPEALAEFGAALQLRPDYSAAHYNLANALATAGRREEAIAHYEAALRAQPAYPEAHHNLASALFELGRLDEAARHYEETLRLAPNFPGAREHLAQVRARLKAK